MILKNKVLYELCFASVKINVHHVTYHILERRQQSMIILKPKQSNALLIKDWSSKTFCWWL